jgi:hypothetical protein
MAGQERRRIGGSTRSWRRHATGAGILAQRPAPRGGASAVGEALRELKVMLTNVIGRNTEARLGDPYPKCSELTEHAAVGPWFWMQVLTNMWQA